MMKYLPLLLPALIDTLVGNIFLRFGSKAFLSFFILVATTACGGPKVPSDITLPARDASKPQSTTARFEAGLPRGAITTGPITTAPTSTTSNTPVIQTPPELATKPINMAFKGARCLNKQCGTLTIRSVAFNEFKDFSAFIDLSLASMASLDSDAVPPYRGLESLGIYFGDTATPKSVVLLEAKLLRNSPTIVVVALSSYIYNGGANGQSSTQYLNWLPDFNRLVGLQTMLTADGMPKYIAVLAQAHQNWLEKNREAMGDFEQFKKQWPFKPSDNVALLAQGLEISFDPYTIAPKSFGEPKILIPYDQLEGVMRPEYLLIANGL
jgi:hypothetical protein